MSSVSVLFYGRRTRSARSASDSDDLGFHSSSHRTLGCNPTHRHRSTSRKAVDTDTCGPSDRPHLRPRSDQRRSRQNRQVTLGEFDEFGRSSSHLRQPCSEAAVPESGPIQQLGGVTETPNQNLVHGDTLNCVRGRYNNNERLPRPVLLARERLLQRLRGVSASSLGRSHERQSGTHLDSYWLNDSGNGQTSTFREQLAETNFTTHATSPAPRQLQEAISNPPAINREPLASLGLEVFTSVTKVDGSCEFSVSDECSICLERFMEGNELIGLPCGHRFHSSCLCPWVQTCRNCPYCRSIILSGLKIMY